MGLSLKEGGTASLKQKTKISLQSEHNAFKRKLGLLF